MNHDRYIDHSLSGRPVGVAMSGGVDSSVSAALLKEAGAKVVGLTMVLRKDQSPEDAQAVANRLAIPLHVIDLTERFASCVIGDFADSYLRGETPNPCAHCNKNIKFGDLLDIARSMGLEALATGHYARRIEGEGGAELHCAADLSRDQSYFLFALSREQIEAIRFPLGDFENKAQTRALAAHYGLLVANKPDSQDICFVPGGDYAAVVETIRPAANKPGEIVDQQGRVLGLHAGVMHYTVGQRKGLHLGGRTGDNNEPLYVLEIDPVLRRVTVGPREALSCDEVFLRDINWLANPIPVGGLPVTVKLRSTQRPAAAQFHMECADSQSVRGKIVLESPVLGVSPGQAGVVYEGTRVLGGGWICKPIGRD